MHRHLVARCLGALIGALLHCGSVSACDVTHTVMFAGLDWDSNAFHTAVAQRILRDGMGCTVDVVPGATIPLHNGLARGDVQIMMEVWGSNTPPSWDAGVAAGKLIALGVNFPDAVQGWFVPKYLVRGEKAAAPDLVSVADLRRHKALFRDPEEPDKGRFLNCIAGWQCEVTNTKKLHAYGLLEHFTNFRPGTGAALDAAILSAIKRRRPVLFYYWGPTWLLGQIGEEVVMLDEPPHDSNTWQALIRETDPRRVRKATAYPVVEVSIGVHKPFIDQAPAIRDFLQRYRTSAALVSEALAHMRATRTGPDEAARNFLKTHPDVWQDWVAPDIAYRVRATLR
jgi:glycine betaine/proline transport system substrate-binding protein